MTEEMNEYEVFALVNWQLDVLQKELSILIPIATLRSKNPIPEDKRDKILKAFDVYKTVIGKKLSGRVEKFKILPRYAYVVDVIITQNEQKK